VLISFTAIHVGHPLGRTIKDQRTAPWAVARWNKF